MDGPDGPWPRRSRRRRRGRLAPGVTVAGSAALAALAILVAGPVEAQDPTGGLEFSGGIYPYHHRPPELAGADDLTEVYALFLDLDRTEGPWTIHVQGRWRNTKLQSFFPSNVWIQEGWAAHEAPPGRPAGVSEARSGDGSSDGTVPAAAPPTTLTLRAGKIYQRIGRFRDGSFFGNVHCFDGLKLDPEFGAEAVLTTRLVYLEWTRRATGGPGALGGAAGRRGRAP